MAGESDQVPGELPVTQLSWFQTQWQALKSTLESARYRWRDYKLYQVLYLIIYCSALAIAAIAMNYYVKFDMPHPISFGLVKEFFYLTVLYIPVTALATILVAYLTHDDPNVNEAGNGCAPFFIVTGLLSIGFLVFELFVIPEAGYAGWPLFICFSFFCFSFENTNKTNGCGWTMPLILSGILITSAVMAGLVVSYYAVSLKSAEALIQRGKTNIDSAHLNLAVRDFEGATRLDPNSAEAFYYLGNVYRDVEDTALVKFNKGRVIKNYSQAIQLNPEYALAYFDRGLFYAHNRKKEMALADLQRAWELCEPYNICEQAWQELEKLRIE